VSKLFVLTCSWSLFVVDVRLAVVSASQDATEKPKKSRSEEEKVVRRKFIIKMLHRIEGKINRIDKRTRVIVAGLSDFLNIPKDYIFLVTCQDEIDQAIVELLFAAGSAGLTTSQIAERLQRYRVNRFFVLDRIKRLNRRFQSEVDRDFVFQHGFNWCLTRFVFNSQGLSEEEIHNTREELNIE